MKILLSCPAFSPMPLKHIIRILKWLGPFAQVEVSEDVDASVLAEKMQGFSGADVKVACRDASLMPMRRLVQNKTPSEIKALKEEGKLEACPSMEDFLAALKKITPSVSESDVAKFEAWEKEFGST